MAAYISRWLLVCVRCTLFLKFFFQINNKDRNYIQIYIYIYIKNLCQCNVRIFKLLKV